MEHRRIVFFVHNIRSSADKSLRKLEGETGWTILEQQHTLTPGAGKIVLELSMRGRRRQVSLHVMFRLGSGHLVH
jgi:hypothetical protein